MTCGAKAADWLLSVVVSRYIAWFFIGVAMGIGALVVGALRIYCMVICRSHDWEIHEETDFNQYFKECRRCGCGPGVR